MREILAKPVPFCSVPRCLFLPTCYSANLSLSFAQLWSYPSKTAHAFLSRESCLWNKFRQLSWRFLCFLLIAQKCLCIFYRGKKLVLSKVSTVRRSTSPGSCRLRRSPGRCLGMSRWPGTFPRSCGWSQPWWQQRKHRQPKEPLQALLLNS